MLLEFSVTNFRSFKEKQTLSMIPATNKKSEQQGGIAVINDKLSVLKSAVIYGANASGKSNLLLALETLQDIVLTSADKNPTEQLVTEIDYFLFDEDSWISPTEFELYFLIKDIRYRYFLSISRGVVERESLYYYPHNRKTKLFDRKKEDDTYIHKYVYTYGEHLKGEKQVIENLTAANQLYLSKAASNNMEILVEIFQAINEFSINLVLDKEVVKGLKLVRNNPTKQFSDNMKSMVCAFDTGIVDFKIIFINMVQESLKWMGYPEGSFNVVIEMEHNSFRNNKIFRQKTLRIEQESLGTQRLFYLSAIVIDALMHGKTIIFDEFERSLHPHISSYIIQMFNNPKINKKNAQLIVATHDTNVINKENGLRRDQVWLVEKDKTGASELFSLSDIEGVRQDTPFEKWYLSGRFGAVPNINSLDIELNFQHETPQVQEA